MLTVVVSVAAVLGCWRGGETTPAGCEGAERSSARAKMPGTGDGGTDPKTGTFEAWESMV